MSHSPWMGRWGTLLVFSLVLGTVTGAAGLAQVSDSSPAPSRERPPRPTGAPRVSASVNESTEADVPQGWPMLLTAYLQVPRSGLAGPAPALKLSNPAGSWAGLLRVELISADGKQAVWPWKPAYTPGDSITLDNGTGGQMMWFILGEQTAALPPGEYSLNVVLHTEPTAAPGSWQGTVRSSLVRVTITPEPAELTPELETQKHLLRAWVDLWRGAPVEALASAEALLAMQPENCPALTAKGDALRELGKKTEAGACYRQALHLFYQQNPKLYEPPVSLMEKVEALSGDTLLGAAPAPATGPVAAPTAPEVSFQLPAGWRRTDRAGGIVLTSPDIPQGETAALVIGKPREMRTDLGAYFAQAWASQSRDTQAGEDTGLQTVAGEAGEEAVVRAAWLKARDGQRTFTLLLIARAGGHVFHFTYRTSSEEVAERDQQVLDRFFQEISFGGAPTPG